MTSQDVVGADIVLHVVNRKSLDPHDVSHTLYKEDCHMQSVTKFATCTLLC